VRGQAWSWALALLGVSGLWLAGSNCRAGWLVGIAAQAAWVGYAVATRQWGFLLSAAAYTVVNARNWRRWAHPASTTAPSGQREPGARQDAAGHVPAAPAVPTADLEDGVTPPGDIATPPPTASAVGPVPQVSLSSPPSTLLTASPTLAALLAVAHAVLAGLAALHADTQPRTCVEITHRAGINVLDANVVLEWLCRLELVRIDGPDHDPGVSWYANRYLLAPDPDVVQAARRLAVSLPAAPGPSTAEAAS